MKLCHTNEPPSIKPTSHPCYPSRTTHLITTNKLKRLPPKRIHNTILPLSHARYHTTVASLHTKPLTPSLNPYHVNLPRGLAEHVRSTGPCYTDTMALSFHLCENSSSPFVIHYRVSFVAAFFILTTTHLTPLSPTLFPLQTLDNHDSDQLESIEM
jgi:hypothetical protein